MAVLAMAGCASPLADGLAREAARAAVARTVEARFPGVPVAPVTDCVIDNASAAEIGAVAIDTASGRPGPRTIDVVSGVLVRPETLSCLGANALPLFL